MCIAQILTNIFKKNYLTENWNRGPLTCPTSPRVAELLDRLSGISKVLSLFSSSLDGRTLIWYTKDHGFESQMQQIFHRYVNGVTREQLMHPFHVQRVHDLSPHDFEPRLAYCRFIQEQRN